MIFTAVIMKIIIFINREKTYIESILYMYTNFMCMAENVNCFKIIMVKCLFYKKM